MAKSFEQLLKESRRERKSPRKFISTFSTTKRPTPKAPKSEAIGVDIPKERGTSFKGGGFQKFFDILQAPQRGLFGFASAAGKAKEEGKPFITQLKTGFKGFSEGIKRRVSFEDLLKQSGMKEGAVRSTLGFAGDVILDPLNVLSGAGLVKIAKKIPGVTKGAKAIKSFKPIAETTELLGRKLVPYFKFPEKLIDAFVINQQDKRAARKVAVVIGQALKEVPDYVKKDIKSLYKRYGKEISDEAAERIAKLRLTQVLRYGSKTPIKSIQEWAGKTIPLVDVEKNLAKGMSLSAAYKTPSKFITSPEGVRGTFRNLAEELVREGVFDRNILNTDTYLPRLYEIFEGTGDLLEKAGLSELPDIGKAGKPFFKTGISGTSRRMLKRLDDAELGRRALFRAKKSIKEIANTPMEELKRIGAKVRLEELGEILHAPEYAAAKGILDEGKLLADHKLINFINRNLEDLATSELGKTVKIPDEKKWGALAGKKIPKAIKDELDGMLGSESKYIKLLDRVTRHWAYGVTIPNPAYHLRNFMSNLYLMYLGGMNPGQYAISKILKKGTKYYDEAVENGIVKSHKMFRHLEAITEGSSEAGKMLVNKKRGLDPFFKGDIQSTRIPGLKGFLRKMEKFGIAIEDDARLALYAKFRNEGKGVREATKLVNKYLFDYQALTPFERKFMRRLFPFYTFPRKAIPLIVETAVLDTPKVSMIPKAGQAIERLTETQAPPSKFLPIWMREGYYIRTPFKDSKRNFLMLDTRIVPFQDLAELGSIRKVASKLGPIPKGAIELVSNKNIFFDREVTNKYNPWQVKAWDTLTNALRSYSPWSRFWASAVKLESAIRDEEDYAGRQKDLWIVLLDILGGLKLQPFDVTKGKRGYRFETMGRRGALKKGLRKARKSDKFFGVPVSKPREKLLEKELLKKQNF